MNHYSKSEAIQHPRAQRSNISKIKYSSYLCNSLLKKDSMSSKNDPEAFYAKLKIQLEETTQFPALYMYKFIVPSTEEKIKQVHQIFNNMGAVINTKKSSKGTYTSVTINVNMKSADIIIEKYYEASAVEGIISL